MGQSAAQVQNVLACKGLDTDDGGPLMLHALRLEAALSNLEAQLRTAARPYNLTLFLQSSRLWSRRCRRAATEITVIQLCRGRSAWFDALAQSVQPKRNHQKDYEADGLIEFARDSVADTLPDHNHGIKTSTK